MSNDRKDMDKMLEVAEYLADAMNRLADAIREAVEAERTKDDEA